MGLQRVQQDWVTPLCSDWCEVIAHCSFDLYFFNNKQCWASFHVFVSHLYVFFREISLIMSNVEHLFTCLLAICMSSSEKYVCIGLFPTFWLGCFFSGIEFYELLMYFGNQSFVTCLICYYFLPFWGLSFHLVYSFPLLCKNF